MSDLRKSFLPTASFLTALLFVLAVPSAIRAQQRCLPAGEMAGVLTKAFQRDVQVKEIRPAPLGGLCEIIVSVQGKTSLLYSDSQGKHIITGSIIDAQARRDLTREALAEFNRFTPEDMKKIASLKALTMGKSGPEVYFVTDPD
jgi:hypothetical protein